MKDVVWEHLAREFVYHSSRWAQAPLANAGDIGSAPKQKSLRWLVEAGGNFIDTGDSYQFESEEIVGEFIALAKGKDERQSHRRL
jgi:aryl-alcohol dehydrogenase-like predicted oxidoreductase